MYIRCATDVALFRSRSFIQSDAPTVKAAAVFMSDVLASKLTASSITPMITPQSIVHILDVQQTGFSSSLCPSVSALACAVAKSLQVQLHMCQSKLVLQHILPTISLC